MAKKQNDTTEFQQGDKVKLLPPKTAKNKPVVIGQGQSPAGLPVTHKGEHVVLPYEQVYQVSENTEARVANLEHNPLPLINAGWLNGSALADRFKKIETKSKTT